MSFSHYERCPRCLDQGRDSRGDNLGVYTDGSAHCFSCGYHRHPSGFTLWDVKEKEDGPKGSLPADFTREVPAAGWQWLLQWGLPYSYWKKYTGYSQAEDRLVLTVGDPVRFSIGRYLGADGHRKWKAYGNTHETAEVIGNQETATRAIVVEDLISAHKVGQLQICIPLFGTAIHNAHKQALKALGRPIVLWLDGDQAGPVKRKAVALQALLGLSVDIRVTPKDPKAYSLDEIKRLTS